MANKKGSVVALEPSTGEILAYISSPGFDPEVMVGGGRGEAFEKLKKDTLDPLFNRPVMAMYPPGSTFKTIMALIGLQENIIGQPSVFKCKGTKKIPGMVACHDHEKIKGVKGAIRYSCNNYFSILMKDFFDLEKFEKASQAYDKWYSYVASFGLGSRIAKEFEYESKGNLPKKEYYDGLYKPGRWKAPTIISLSVGQGELLMTPIQIANVFSAIANKGYFISPHLIKNIDGLVSPSFVDLDTNYIDISPEHFIQVINGLEEVVKQGTGVGSKIKDISMCGKTGTAENPHGDDHSVFAAFAPKDKPKIAIAVFVENSGFGSTWAAPIASLMIEMYLSKEIKGNYRKQLEKKMLKGRLINIE
jgi:penicillin-binding protein 2